jgi:putative ubiquitin-RnfH superfamily antitoxin RatB of RatAB toxin-antitoxin module
MADADFIDIEVAYAEPDCQLIVPLRVPAGTSAEQAVRRSGLMQRFPAIDAGPGCIGVFGVPVPPDTLLAQGDRVEIYRPLRVSPKEARRLRALRSRKS